MLQTLCHTRKRKKIRTVPAEEVTKDDEMRIDMEHTEVVDADMHDESGERNNDVVMTLGQTLLEISRVDPLIRKWTEKVSRENEDVYPASGCGPGDATSIAGTPFLSQVDVSEVYSPPRVTSMARNMGLHAGSAMNLRAGFDFTRRTDREEARKRIKEEKPRLLVGSAECTMFSTLQHLSP